MAAKGGGPAAAAPPSLSQVAAPAPQLVRTLSARAVNRDAEGGRAGPARISNHHARAASAADRRSAYAPSYSVACLANSRRSRSTPCQARESGD